MSDWHQRLGQFQVAVMLLTRLPAGTLSSPVPKLADAAWAFPVVGLVVGALSAMGLAMALWFGLPPALAAIWTAERDKAMWESLEA